MAKPIAWMRTAAGLPFAPRLRTWRGWPRCSATARGSRCAAPVARILVQQRHDDHARLEVVADQAADDARARDVAAQLLGRLRRAVVVVGHHRAAAEAFLGDLGPAHRRRPQRLDPGAVHARRQHQFVADLAQRVQVLRVVDVALRVLDDDAQRVAQAAQVVAVLQVVLDVRMTRAGSSSRSWRSASAAIPRRRASSTVSTAQHDDHRAAVVEHQPFQAGARSCGRSARARPGRAGRVGGRGRAWRSLVGDLLQRLRLDAARTGDDDQALRPIDGDGGGGNGALNLRRP